MQTTPQTSSPQTQGFEPIPTRIREVPPLVVDRDEALRGEVTSRLEAVALGLAQTHRAAAEAYLSQAMYEEALPHLEAAARFGPGVMEFHNQLGYVQYLIGDDPSAIASFGKVIELEPGNSDALYNLGMVLFGQERMAEAEDCFRRSLEARPNDADTWNNRGVCLFQLDRTADARACFERALQIEPENEDARENLQSC